MTKRRRRTSTIGGSKLPKGGYRLPDGSIAGPISQGVPATIQGKQARIRVRAVHRKDPDVQRLVRVLIEVAERSLAEKHQDDAA